MTWTLVILILVVLILVNLTLILAGWLMKKSKLRSNSVKVVTRFTSCQSCQSFISCAMAGVTECPLLK